MFQILELRFGFILCEILTDCIISETFHIVLESYGADVIQILEDNIVNREVVWLGATSETFHKLLESVVTRINPDIRG